MSERRVVITGLGVAGPLGLGASATWDALNAGRVGIGPYTAFDASALPSRAAAEVPDFKLADYIPKTYRKSAKVMSRDIQIAVVSAYLAVKDAGLNTKCIVDRGEAEGEPNIVSSRFGANIGAGLVSPDLTELAGALSSSPAEDGTVDLKAWGAEGMTNLTPLWLLKFLPNMLACHVTIVHDAQGPSNTLTCGEASSHLAIGEAFRTVAGGSADVCICGGAESKVNPTHAVRQSLWGFLDCEHNDDPARACRPFAKDRAGSVIAEGGGLVILESLEHATARGARIYGELVGFGAASSAARWDGPDVSGRPAALAIEKALADSKTSANEVDLVVPFGHGSREYDAAEAKGWASVMGDRLAEIPALCVRGAVGNNGAGSGAIDFAAAVLSLHHNSVPGSPKTGDLDDGIPFRFHQGDPIDAKVNCAVSAAVSVAGGQSAALVIKRYEG